MRGFKANNCRLCQKVFCCKKCRIKHEKNTHKIVPDCDICVYGIFFFANIDDNFLQHLESSHLPVHCLNCKKIFSSIEDLLQHKKCEYFQNKEHSPKTPLFKDNPAIRLTTDDNDSPIFQELQRQEHLNYILATSTPMQRGEETNLMFEKSKEAITPVDKPIRVMSKSIIKKNESAKCDEQLSKRRVTFGETPSANTVEKNMSREDMTGDRVTPTSKLLKSLDVQSLHEKSNYTGTPGMGTSTCQFYSAKTETGTFNSAKSNVSSKSSGINNNCNLKNFVENFTPVGIPNKSKLLTVKGDIYKNQDDETNCLPESREYNAQEEFKNDNLEEVSMELCTPGPLAKNVNPLKSSILNDQDGVDKETINNFSVTENVEPIQKSETKPALHFFTPAKPRNTGNNVVKGDIYKNSEEENISPITEITKENEESGKNINQNNYEGSPETKKNTIAGATGHDTLWLSAIGLEESENDSKQQNIENARSVEIIKHTQVHSSPLLGTSAVSPPRNSQRRVSIVMPTPILKTTKVQMKFHFPAHLSSTPNISSGGAVKVKQTKIVEDNSTKVIQTPSKTPQGKLCELIQRKLIDANRRRILASLTDIEAVPSTSSRDIVPLDNIKEDTSASDPIVRSANAGNTLNGQYEDTYPSLPSDESETDGVSGKSMTESNLWTSMTRIVKSVLGGFGTVSQNNSDISTNKNMNSFKRQLSDSDTGEFLEAPRLKRFKFTDIKCRKSIRDLGALELPQRLPAPTPSLASIEILKSVSTFYGHQSMRIQCDKATQTDNYLMYGWHPYF